MMAWKSSEFLPESPYIWRARNTDCSHRLVCFPHAGAGATAYAAWAQLLPAAIELVGVQLPGRQNRIAEEPFQAVGPLVATLLHVLRPVLDVPFAFFGHSGGAVLAHELAVALRARGRRGPEHLFLSGRAAPGVTDVATLHDLPDDELRAAVHALGGVEPEIAADDDVMAALLPVLRADFGLWERHEHTAGVPLDCAITALCGASDPRATPDMVQCWRACTTAAFTVRSYPGGHFYFLDSPGAVVADIGRATLAAAPAGSTA